MHAEAAPSATRIVDRTLRCTTGIQGGFPVIFVNGRSAYGDGGRTAGWPLPPGFTSGAASFHDRRCVATRERVGFSRRGLLGGAAGQFGDEYQCKVPRSFLVRVRAVFREPVALRLLRDRSAYSAEGRVDQGRIAVQTLAKKPLSYREVADSGRARVFTGRSCL